MKNKLFNNLLLFSLFGIALGFFGILYEGVAYGPKLFDTSMDRMVIWKGFFSMINPIIYYAPWYHLATIVLIVLFFKTPKEKIELKRRLKIASILQIVSLGFIIYILNQINFKDAFSNLETAKVIIPDKAILFNILSICRLIVVAISLSLTFKAYIQTQKEQN